MTRKVLLRSQVDGWGREVVSRLQERGALVAIVSSGVDVFVGMVASMLKVDDWIANGFEWDEEGWMIGPLPSRVLSFEKGLAVEKFRRINDLTWRNRVGRGLGIGPLHEIQGSGFIAFNPSARWSLEAFEEASVPIVDSDDLRNIWPLLFEGEEF